MNKKLIIVPFVLLVAVLCFNAQIFEYIPSEVEAQDSFTVKVTTGSNNPAGGDVVKGTRGLTLLEVELRASGLDGIKISSLVFKVQKENSRSAKKVDVSNFRLYDGDDQRVGQIPDKAGLRDQGTELENGKIVFSDFNLFIPQNTTKVFTLRADLGENIEASQLRAVFDSQSLGLSDITSQRSDSRPAISGTVIGNYFTVTDNFIHLTEPWQGLVWQVGQQYRISWNHRFMVDKVALILIGYEEENASSPSKSFPIKRYAYVDRNSSWDSYDYTVPQSLSQSLGKYKYFKVRAVYEVPGQNNTVTFYESTTGGFFRITTDEVISQGAELIRAHGNDRVYKLIDGKRLWISTVSAFKSLGYSSSDVRNISLSELNSYPQAKLVKTALNPKIYYLTNSGLKRHILNMEVFDSYNDRMEDVVVISESELNSFEDSVLIQQHNQSKIYKIENGVKRWIKSAQAFEQLGLDWAKVAPVNQTEFDAYVTGSSIN